MSTPPPVTRLRQCLAALTLLAVAGCGGGFAERFVKVITARFVPAQATVAPGAGLDVELEVTCDKSAVESIDGAPALLVKLDPSHTLAGVVGATLVLPPPTLVGPVVPDQDGFVEYQCSTPTGDADLRTAHIAVVIKVAAGAPPLSTTLTAAIIAPLKDSTTADLALTVSAAAAPVPSPGPGGNLLINGAFDEPIGFGGLPIAPGNWRGDPSRIVGTDQGIAPRSAATMLRFDGNARTPGSSLSSSRQWQIVDLARFHDAVAAGTVSARLAAFFNRISGETVDSQFDLRLFAYDGAMAELPVRYAAGTHLAMQTTTVQAGAFQWQEAAATLALPAATTYLLVEIRAVEGSSEGLAVFDGNYADDASLTLIGVIPPPGARP